MPTLNDHHRALHALAGTWIGTEVMSPSPWDPVGGTATARIENRIVIGGFAVAQDYTQTRNGIESFHAHGVFRYDDASSQYELHWIDTMGWPSKFTGTLTNGILALELKMPQGAMRASWDLTVKDRITYASEVSGDSVNWGPFMKGEYRRG